MANIRKIVTEEDPQLHQPSVEVRRFNDSLHRLLDDMRATMYQANGCGLAAPQVGVNKRIIVVDDGENGFFELVNPRIIAAGGATEGVEFCLSVPDRGGRVRRAKDIRIEAQDRFGGPVTVRASDFHARVFQHEIDHLDGVLFTDVMSEEVRPQEEDAAPRAPRAGEGRTQQGEGQA